MPLSFILKRLQKRSAFSVCLKYLLKPRPGLILNSSMIRQRKQLTRASKSLFTYSVDLSTIVTHLHMVLELCEGSLLRTILFRYAPHFLGSNSGQQSRLKEVIQMQISSAINSRRLRNKQFFLSCFTRSASSFLFICFMFLVLVRFLKGCSLFVYSHLFFSSLYSFLLASVAYLALDSRQQEFRLPTW